MRPLDATQLLNAWEQGLNQPILERALILILTACPELDFEAVANMSIGERDARLLVLREWIFGTHLLNTAQCPQCGELVEWESRTGDLRIQSVDGADLAEEFTFEVDNYRLHFRLPTSKDVAAVMVVAQSDRESGGMALARRCIVSADQAGDSCRLADLPPQVLVALSRQIEKLDPQAEIRTALTCPACAHQWEVLFDIAGFLWDEIHSWAERTLRSVNTLASAYGWSEREILRLSPVRRQLYQGMVNR